MLFGQKMDLKELIISHLSQKSMTSLDLFKLITLERRVTKQGFYKSLRELVAEEIVIKNKLTLLISPVWLSHLRKLIESSQTLTASKLSQEIISLQDGDSITFRFKSMLELLILWAHYFYVFCKSTQGPIVFFNTHNFWLLFRSDIESEVYIWAQEQGRQIYNVTGYNTQLDKYIAQSVKKTYGIESASDLNTKFKEYVLPAVFGDYVISTILEPEIVQRIHNIFLQYTRPSPTVELEIQTIVQEMKKSKIVIERNSKKAEKLRKKLMNQFIFYKSK